MQLKAAGSALPAPYLIWLSGAMGSQLGNVLMYFALGWAATAHGGIGAGLVLTAVNLPRVVLLLVGGAAGDLFSAWRVMVGGDAVMLVATSALAFVAYLVGTPLWLLIAAGVVFGTVDAFYLPASGSMPRWLVDREQLAGAVALRQTIAQIVGFAGGPVGGIVMAGAGFAAAAGLDAVTFALILVSLLLVRQAVRAPATPSGASLLVGVADGVRVAFGRPVLRRMLPMVGVAAGFLLPVSSLLVPLLARTRGWDAGATGWIAGGQGLGVIIVSLLVLHKGALSRPGLAATAGLFGAAVGELLIALAPVAVGAIAAAVVTGAGLGLFTAHVAPLLLTAAPPSHLSRVQSLLVLVQSTCLLVSNTLLGLWSDSRGAVTAIVTCTAALALVAAWGLVSPELRAARLEAPPTSGLNVATGLAPAVLRPRRCGSPRP
jgi:MFS family permease